MTEHFIITLRVLDRVYRLKVRRKDEQIYRDAVAEIEKKTTQYRNYFSGAGSDKLLEQDYLAMTSIQALSETVELDSENKHFQNRIKSLISELDSYLKASK
ncbi:MAG TPA: cell division protein ZapA [Dysgonomonas sp.]|nr:cell division protein ZapA [Dysgonomonas sp.]